GAHGASERTSVHRRSARTALIAASAVAALGCDLRLGFAVFGGWLYVVPVLLAGLLAAARTARTTALICAALVMVGLLARAPEGSPALWVALGQRGSSLFAIWLAARLGVRDGERRRLRAMLDALPHGVVLLDHDFSIAATNQAVEKR